MICNKCRSPNPKDGKIYCMLCQMSLMDTDDDDAEMIRNSKIKGAQTQISVKLDTNTGDIVGFEDFIAKLGIKNFNGKNDL